jgi:hypothetical protein
MNKRIDGKLPLSDLAAARHADAEKFDQVSKEAWENKDFNAADLARQGAAWASAGDAVNRDKAK